MSDQGPPSSRASRSGAMYSNDPTTKDRVRASRPVKQARAMPKSVTRGSP